MKPWLPIVLSALAAATLVGCAAPTPTDQEAMGTSTALQAPQTGLPLKPQVACNLLADQGLGAAGGYQPSGGGTFVCSSFKQTLPLGEGVPHTLQFLALGSADSVDQLRVELDLRSPGDVQASLRLLLAQVEDLTQRVLGVSVPEPAQVAIRSGVPGSWPLGQGTLKIERITTFTTRFVATLQ